MVPEGWTRRSFGELFDFKNGYNTEKSDYGSGTPFINVSEVLKNEALHVDQIPGQVRIADAQLAAFGVKRGDILLNRTSETPDEVGFTTVYLDTAPVIFGGFVIRARPLTSELVPEFCRYAFRQPDVREQIIRRSQGAIRSNIGQGELSQVSVALPPLAEQQKIAEILGTWDKSIETTEALLANARTQKRALMQSLLTGTRRFPGFEDQPWREVRLGDVSTLVTKGTTPTSVGFEFTNHGVSFVKAENIDGSGTVAQSDAYVSQECHDALRRSQLEAGDILVTIAGAIGRVGLVPEEILPANTNQAVAIIRMPSDADVSRSFVSYWLRGPFIQSILRDTAAGGAQPNVNLAQVSNLPMKCPTQSEQELIVMIFDDASLQVEQYVQQLDHLRTEKKSLMQQLLTGKRRVVV